MSWSHRQATREDLPSIVEIYNATIPSRLVTADLEPVSIESRIGWFEQHKPDFRPLWVAQRNASTAGWLSFSTFYGRPAYNKTAELSIYVGESFRNRGLGSYLLAQAIAHAPSIGIDRLIGFLHAEFTTRRPRIITSRSTPYSNVTPGNSPQRAKPNFPNNSRLG